MGCYEVSYIIVLLSASPFMSVSICSMYFSASMMGVCVCVCVCITYINICISSSWI